MKKSILELELIIPCEDFIDKINIDEIDRINMILKDYDYTSVEDSYNDKKELIKVRCSYARKVRMNNKKVDSGQMSLLEYKKIKEKNIKDRDDRELEIRYSMGVSKDFNVEKEMDIYIGQKDKSSKLSFEDIIKLIESL